MSGLVSLVGAGPGPGLITLLGLERLRACDAVVFDELIDAELLREAPPGAELIAMGKRAGRPSAAQGEIIETLLRLAAEGKRVVRLKGGDPLVFGRGGEELEALNAAGAACELIPGVTSAAAVPALCGIPLTQRGLARGFAVITAQTADSEALPEYFGALALFPGTLCVLMGLGRLREIAESLVRAGMSAETPCAVAAAGNARERRCVRGTLADIAKRAEGFAPPAVIVIGEAAALDLSPVKGLPLAGKRVGLTGTRRMNAKLSRELIRLGAEPFTACELVLSPLPAADETPVDCGCLVFTSAEGVRLYFERLLRKGLDARALGGVKTACVGRATAAELRRHGLIADLVPAEQTTGALARLLLERLPEHCSIALYRSDMGEPALAAALSDRFELRDIRAYTAAPGDYAAPRALVEAAAAFAFTSAAGARAALERLAPLPEGVLLAALGAPTARPLTGLPNRLAIAAEPSARALAEVIADNIM